MSSDRSARGDGGMAAASGRTQRHGVALLNRGEAPGGDVLTRPARGWGDDDHDADGEKASDQPGEHEESLQAEAGERSLAAQGTRRTTGTVTSLAAVWPEVSRRLYGFLRKRGVSRSDADDVVQSVAERVIARRVTFDEADDLLHWCLTVARNLEVDQRRRAARHTSLVTQDEIGGPQQSLEDSVLTRLRLGSALTHLAGFSDRDQRLILASAEEAGSISGRDRVAKHRARGRLLRLVGPPSILAAFGQQLTRWATRASTVPAVPAALSLAVGFAAVGAIFSSTLTSPVTTPHLLRAERTTTIPASEPSLARVAAPRRAEPMQRGRSGQSAAGPKEASVPVLITPDSGHVARVDGHPRRASDTGLVCVDDAPLLAHVCVGPSGLPHGASATQPLITVG